MMDIRQFLKENTRIPVIGAPLFTVSYPELVIAQCKAGIVGSFPALNARPADQLEAVSYTHLTLPTMIRV